MMIHNHRGAARCAAGWCRRTGALLHASSSYGSAKSQGHGGASTMSGGMGGGGGMPGGMGGGVPFGEQGGRGGGKAAPPGEHTIKSSPQFAQSYDSIFTEVREKMPFEFGKVTKGHFEAAGLNWGDKIPELEEKEAKAENEGKKPYEYPAVQAVKSYFKGMDISLSTQSARAQYERTFDQRGIDKESLKTSSEAQEYYYDPVAPEDAVKTRVVHVVVTGCVLLGAILLMRVSFTKTGDPMHSTSSHNTTTTTNTTNNSSSLNKEEEKSS